MADDSDSMFARAGFALPTAAPAAAPAAPISDAAAPGSTFAAAGFKIPDKTSHADNLEETTAQGARGKDDQPPAKPGRGWWQAIKDYPGHVLNGLVDTAKIPGNIMTSNPYPQGSESWQYFEDSRSKAIAEGAPQLATMVGGTEFPRVGVGPLVERAATAVAPSTKAVNALVDAVGPENMAAAVTRMNQNPRLTLADVSDPVRTMTQGLIDPAQPKAQNAIVQAVKERAGSRLEAANTAFTEAMGPAPDVIKMVDGLKDRARAAGKEAIQPALANAKAVDVTPVIAAIDKEVQPGIAAMKSGLPLSPRQEELWRLRNQLVDSETGEQAFDPARLHEIQSRTGDLAYQYQKSPDGKTRNIGNGLRDANEKLVDAIDEASKTADPIPAKFRNVQLETSSGKTDPSGVWFLRGDKPTYAQATKSGADATLGPLAGELDNFQSMTGKNASGHPITVWYKPGEEARAKSAVDNFAKGPSGGVENEINYHLANADAYGYPRSAAESYVRQRFGDDANSVLGPEGAGPYRQARAKFKDAKDISEAFESGFDTLKNRSGLSGALEDSPQAFRDWMKDATPEEVVARRLGTRADIDQKINSVKNGALKGETITAIPYNQEKLRALFGDGEANRLIRVMKDSADEAATNAKLLAGAKTAETQAGQRALEVPKREPFQLGSLTQALLPSTLAEVAGQYMGSSPGLTAAGLVASGLTAGGIKAGVQTLRAKNALARNAEFAQRALATGPARKDTINALLSHPKVRRELNKSGNALTAP